MVPESTKHDFEVHQYLDSFKLDRVVFLLGYEGIKNFYPVIYTLKYSSYIEIAKSFAY